MSRFGPTVPYDATAVRVAWETLPPFVRESVAAALGGEPAEVRMAGGGFSSGFAARVRSSSGAELFVKAAGPGNSRALDAYRREALVNPALPAGVPAPRLEFAADFEDWTVLGFEAVDGRAPTLPMNPRDLDLMLDAWARAAAALTPAPQALLDLGVTADPVDHKLRQFASLDAGSIEPFPLPPALEGRTAELATIERGIDAALTADAVMHFDLRPDNMIVGADQAWICDWNWVEVHSTWFDTACFLVAAHGDGHDADALFHKHPTAAGVTADELDAVLASITGYYLSQSYDPPIPEVSPYLRRHQRWSGLAAADWLARRRGWS
ncbi:phosphotransferase [Glycomyces paridis]|uniref:Aminoglycoside phosphotransferase family protein n=1 Tax=Glycomyces paridis TaxID=2126555 RepID=A0A4S8PKM7_9ACTN|nr:phosphotransferase [Glycomyces paridis]THV31308.1 aminoglycoside phosphotransferase family protein [Glycomyces paridis]